MMTDAYIKKGHELFFRKTVVEAAEKIALSFSFSLEDPTRHILNLLCSFGWEIPSLYKESGKAHIRILHPPLSEYGFLYQALVINGFLNKAFHTTFSLEHIEYKLQDHFVALHYIS